MRLATAAALLSGALLLPAVPIAPAAAQDAPPVFRLRTAGELARICAAESNTGTTQYYEYGFCYGYSAGALDYHRAITPPSTPPLFCAPTPPPSFETMRGRYVAWVNSAPANAAKPAMDSIFEFLRVTFPCPTPPAAPARRR